jgi:hypothetical protein
VPTNPNLPFGVVAAEYDRIRPGYPSPLVDAVLARAFPEGTPYGPGLEAGAGTGLATQMFAGFPLLLSAQAWHWIDAVTRWDVAADVLRPGGIIALFWNADRIADRAVQDGVDAAYTAIAPINNWSTEPEDEAALAVRWPAAELRAHPAFTAVTTRLFRWDRMI